jgi:NAD+-dependent protein deacetylase SIR2
MSDSTEEICVRTDGPPPPKRRRVAAPAKPRTTSYIDLESRGEDEDENLGRLLSALRKKKKIVVIAGAGISVSAGSKLPTPARSRCEPRGAPLTIA